jgi:hypothetical protein
MRGGCCFGTLGLIDCVSLAISAAGCWLLALALSMLRVCTGRIPVGQAVGSVLCRMPPSSHWVGVFSNASGGPGGQDGLPEKRPSQHRKKTATQTPQLAVPVA